MTMSMKSGDGSSDPEGPPLRPGVKRRRLSRNNNNNVSRAKEQWKSEADVNLEAFQYNNQEQAAVQSNCNLKVGGLSVIYGSNCELVCILYFNCIEHQVWSLRL